MTLQSLIHKLHVMFAKSNFIVFVAIKLRNQLNAIINFSICRSSGFLSSGETKFLEKIADEIETFIDVGAHVGDYTEFLLNTKKQRKQKINALLFEPSENAFNYLKTKFTDCDNVEIIQYAVGSKEGSAIFYDVFHYSGGTGSSFAFENLADIDSLSSYQVDITTITHQINQRNWNKIDFLKIDAEGYDFKVLEGCQALLEEKRIRVVQFEYTTKWLYLGDTLIYALKFLESFGYSVYLLNSNGLSKFNYELYAPSLKYANFVAFSPKDLTKFTRYIPN